MSSAYFLEYLNEQHQNGVINISFRECFMFSNQKNKKSFLCVIGVAQFLYKYKIPINLN
jgi:hypothetical protein